jgi:hypothetical protein
MDGQLVENETMMSTAPKPAFNYSGKCTKDWELEGIS